MADWDEALQRMLLRVNVTLAEPGGGWPHHGDADSGEWTRSRDGDWTGGFWNGQLWLAAAATGQHRYRTAAEDWAERLRPRARSETVFRGFLFWYGAGIGEVLVKSDKARSVGQEGAKGLLSQYNRAAGLIPLGAEAEEAADVGATEANIDGVPGGTPLLNWAGNREEALSHVQRHVELCLREDGSVVQSASFDPATGAALRRYTHKGLRDDSTWTRAQAWAMLGFAQAARIDRDRFAEPARRVADWWLEHLPPDRIARWDFDDGDPGAALDTSGTAIATAALLKLAAVLPERADTYFKNAERMTEAMIARHLRPSGALGEGCYNHRLGLATRSELIWGDYFLMESLCALTGRVLTTGI